MELIRLFVEILFAIVFFVFCAAIVIDLANILRGK